jgi:hypothetical protein
MRAGEVWCVVEILLDPETNFSDHSLLPEDYFRAVPPGKIHGAPLALAGPPATPDPPVR